MLQISLVVLETSGLGSRDRLRPIFAVLVLALDSKCRSWTIFQDHPCICRTHLVACLLLPVTQVTKFLTSLSLALLFFMTKKYLDFQWREYSAMEAFSCSPHRARMSDSGLCNLVFAKCNAICKTDQYCDSDWLKIGPQKNMHRTWFALSMTKLKGVWK